MTDFLKIAKSIVVHFAHIMRLRRRNGKCYALRVVGRAKRAPHWGVQSRFRVIYIIIYNYVVGMSRMSN